MTRVKICGITNKEDARAAVDYGVDAIGLILVPESPRYVGKPRRFRENSPFPYRIAVNILTALPPFVQSVGVVNECQEEGWKREYYEFNAMQFYEGDCSRTVSGTTACIRAFRMRDENIFEEIEQALKWAQADAILLDTYHKDKLGGSGETFNWDLAVEAKKRFEVPIILAGGLTADNVAEAIAKVQPYAVDVSSGVEAEPGRKDHAKMKAFIRAVRRADL